MGCLVKDGEVGVGDLGKGLWFEGLGEGRPVIGVRASLWPQGLALRFLKVTVGSPYY